MQVQEEELCMPKLRGHQPVNLLPLLHYEIGTLKSNKNSANRVYEVFNIIRYV